MTRVQLIVVALCGLMLLGGCRGRRSAAVTSPAPPAQAQPQAFTSPDGRFTARFPSRPQEQTKVASGVTMKIFSVENNNGAYLAAYGDMPIPAGESDAQLQARLDGAREGMVQNVGGTLTGSSRITLAGKYPGREVTADLPQQQGALRARVYIVDRRLYQVMVVGKKSWVNQDDATKFLDSFALTQ